MFIQSDSVRHEFPLGTSYSRGVLRHVPGFPGLRLLCPIRHPSTLALASLPDHSLFNNSTRAHAVSRLFTFSCPNAVSFIISPQDQESSGLPGFLDASLPACHGLMTPPDLHTHRHHGCFCVAFGAR